MTKKVTTPILFFRPNIWTTGHTHPTQFVPFHNVRCPQLPYIPVICLRRKKPSTTRAELFFPERNGGLIANPIVLRGRSSDSFPERRIFEYSCLCWWWSIVVIVRVGMLWHGRRRCFPATGPYYIKDSAFVVAEFKQEQQEEEEGYGPFPYEKESLYIRTTHRCCRSIHRILYPVNNT